MQIRSIETFPLFYRLPKPYGDANGIKAYRASYFIRIETDAGIEGWGECADWLPTLHKGFQERIIPYLIGKRVADRSTLVRTIRKWHSRCSSAVSMALTEIFAKQCGVSVCDLWGGKVRQRVPVYASFQSYSEEPDWDKQSLLAAEKTLLAGFRSLKVKIGGAVFETDRRHILELQRLLENRAGLALDANQSYDASESLRWLPLLAQWSNIMWLEEPIPTRYAHEYKGLRQQLTVPLAGGENTLHAADFTPFLRNGAIDMLTPDPLHMGGLEEYLQALQLARNFGIRVSPHAFDGALSRLYAVFAQACLPAWSKMGDDDCEPVEWDAMDNPFTGLIPLLPENGTVAVPDGAGIGVEIDRDKLNFYRWDGGSYGY